MPLRSKFIALLSVFVFSVVTASTVAAKSSKVSISGKVSSAKNYVVGLNLSNGRNLNKKLGSAGVFNFKVSPSNAKSATLQLVKPDGSYFGPVVLAKKSKKAYLTLSGQGIKLGTISLKKGYATPKKAVATEAVSFKSGAKTNSSGAPTGAGKLGLVVSGGKASIAASGDSGSHAGSGSLSEGVDSDQDGIVNAFDADDNANGIIDNTDPAISANSSSGFFSTLYVNMDSTLNVNTGSVAQSQIDDTIKQNLALIFYVNDEQFGVNTGAVSSVDVDCFTLVYCARGTGTATISGLSESSPSLPRGSLWVDYSPNGSGFPNLEPINNSGSTANAMGVLPNVTTADIHAGDTFNLVAHTSGGEIGVLRTVSPYFVTSPAVISYNAGAGEQSISYPASNSALGSSESNPIQMTSGSLTLTFYKPQRLTIPGAESGEYRDIGHLHYGIPLEVNGQELSCAGHYSNLSSTLSESSSGGNDFSQQLFPLTDSSDDRAPSASDTLSFTIDIAGCLAANGTSASGQTLRLAVTGTGESRAGGVDRTAQTINVKLP